MALTPQNFTVDDEQTEPDVIITEEQPAPSKTWRLDFNSGRIRGFIDGEQAIRQFIRKALMTARNRFIIYDDQYGSELEDLIGQNITPQLIETEIPRLIREALIYDDRIEDVSNIVVTHNSTKIYVTFDVELVTGDLLTEEVTV